MMRILDKLKPQPRWKHADPAVRLEAVPDLTDPTDLATIAESDSDARVRRAAVSRVDDAAVLGRVAAGDADEDTRDRAGDRLLGMATAPDDSAMALAAVRGLRDARRLAAAARSEAVDAVRSDALARLTDEGALGGVARHAKVQATAVAALERLTSPSEMLDVALNSAHRDVAMAAFDRLAPASATTDAGLLRSIEARAQHKSVGKRARTFLQEQEDAEAARRAAEEELRRNEASICQAVEALGSTRDPSAAAAELARLSAAWSALEGADADAAARFERGAAQAREHVDRLTREAEEAAERARVKQEALATRDALCARLETIDGDDVLAQLAPIEEEWRSLAPLVGNGPEADRLAERFARGLAACHKRHEMGAALAETRATLEALAAEAEALLTRPDAQAAAQRWQALAREAKAHAATLAAASRPAADLDERFAAVGEGFAAREEAAREAAVRARQEGVARLQRMVERSKRAADAEAMTLREGERLMRDLGVSLDEAAQAEQEPAVSAATADLRTLQERIAPRVRELRDMDEWRRFANAQQQEQLIAMAEAVAASMKAEEEAGKASDLAATARALREMHTKWQDVSEAPRHSAQKLWDRFRTATDFIRSRCDGYFTKLREERGTNLATKASLVEQAEALAQSTDWARAAARIQELQTEWQQVGPVPREQARDLAHRFRTACNLFFSRRREDLTTRKKVWTDNLAHKEAMCARAEELAASTEWDAGATELKRLQAEWKTVGPVRRNKSEEVWNRFRAAADHFFERYHRRHEIAIEMKLAEREAIVAELERLAGADEPAPDLGNAVQQLRSTWFRSVPIPAAGMAALADRWQAALTNVAGRWPEAFAGTDLDPAAVRQRMDKLVVRVEALLAEAGDAVAPGKSQTEQLAARLQLALKGNTIGGRASEESKWRAAADSVREAQSAWQRLAPLPGSAAGETRSLEARFRDACRRVMEHARRQSGGPVKRPDNKQTAVAG